MAKISTLLRALACLLILCGFAPVQPVGALPGGPIPELVKDINPIASLASNPKAFMQAGEVTYFFVTNADNQNELWITDGTSQGTVLVKQNVGPGGKEEFNKWISPPGWYNVYNGIVYFAGVDYEGSSGLWRTDGTEGGTFELVGDPGPSSYYLPENLTLYEQYLVFTCHSNMLFRIDNTNTPPKYMLSLPTVYPKLIYFSGKLYFTSPDDSPETTFRLYETDTTSFMVVPGAANLELDELYYSYADLFIFKDNLYFSARFTPGEELSFGYELYKLNTLHQTELVMDINPTGNANPWIMGVAGDWLIFSAVTGTGERTMWRTNNIPGGIYQVPPFSASSGGTRLGSLGDRLLFASGGNLWAIDGPSGNTYLFGTLPEHNFLVWASYGNKLYYSGGDFFTGIEIKVSDGFSSSFYKDINPGLPGSLPLAMAPCGSSLCISADDGQHGTELWVTNGNPDDVQMVADINPRPINSNPVNITTAGNMTFFHADDGVKADSLWRTNGTPAGTIPLIQDETITFPTYFAGDPRPLFSVDARVFFIASDPEHGRELWVSDGTPGGTRVVKDIAPGMGDPHVNLITPSAGRVFFVAHSGPAGSELMVSDGSEPGTYLVKDILGDPMFDDYRFYKEIVPYGNGVAFILGNFEPRSSELWISDGTEDGTKNVATFGDAHHLAEVDGKIFFSVQEEVDGELELYQSDGTPAGTSVMGSLGYATGYASGVTGVLGVGENVFVFVNDASWIKLWVSRPGSGLELLHTFDRTNFYKVELKGTAVANGRLVMSIYEHDYYDVIKAYLWVSDGTVDGTLLMPGDYDFIEALQANGDGFIFNAESGTEGRQIWKSDGTPEGTEQLTHFSQAMCSTHEMGLLGEAILLPLDDFEAGGTAGCELWTLTDGLWRKVFIPAVMR